MAKVTVKGNASNTIGNLPAVGTSAVDFSLVAGDLSEKGLKEYQGKRKVLNIVPSLDTGVCAASARHFNKDAGNLENTVVLIISADLPFAQGRFCAAEGLKHVVPLSTFRSSFASDYNLEIAEGPLKGLCSRAVIILDEDNKVIYTEQVPEISQEPNYSKALTALKV